MGESSCDVVARPSRLYEEAQTGLESSSRAGSADEGEAAQEGKESVDKSGTGGAAFSVGFERLRAEPAGLAVEPQLRRQGVVAGAAAIEEGSGPRCGFWTARILARRAIDSPRQVA